MNWMINTSKSKVTKPVVVFLLAFIWLSLNLGGNSIYILDEAKNASCAIEMMQRDDWVVPTFNGELRTDKPVLHYYFMILAYEIFGINPFAARFFSAVFGALTVMITFLFASKYLSEKVGLWVVIVFFSSLHFALQFHLAVPDPYLVFFITASLFAFYNFFEHNQFLSLFWCYACIGFGTLVKGPVAIVIPGAVIFVFLLMTKSFKWQVIRKFNPFLGALLVLIIAMPWYILVHIKTNGLWTEGFFLQHNVGRFSNTMEGHGGIFLLTPLFVLVGLLPFSLLMLPAIKLAYKERQHTFLTFCLSVVSIIIVFFSIASTKLPNYTVPSYPFIAVLLANFIQHTISGKVTLKHWPFAIYLLITIIIPVAIYVALQQDTSLTALKSLSMFFLILPLGAGFGWWFMTKGQVRMAFFSWFLSFLVLTGAFFIFIFPRIDQVNPVVQSKTFFSEEHFQVAYYKRFNPAYAFLLQQPINKLNSLKKILDFKGQHAEFYLISRKKYLKELNGKVDYEILIEKKDLFESSITVLLKVK